MDRAALARARRFTRKSNTINRSCLGRAIPGTGVHLGCVTARGGDAQRSRRRRRHKLGAQRPALCRRLGRINADGRRSRPERQLTSPCSGRQAPPRSMGLGLKHPERAATQQRRDARGEDDGNPRSRHCTSMDRNRPVLAGIQSFLSHGTRSNHCHLESIRSAMKILMNSLLIVIAAGIGLGVGFLLRGNPKHQQVVSVHSEPQTISKRLSALRRDAPPRIDDSPLTTKLARDLSMSSGVTRWLYWLEALDKAQPADFPRLVRLAQTNSTALRFVTARWVEVAPRHMFDTLMATYKGASDFSADQLQGTLANTLFTEWPKRDPDAAIAALNEVEHLGMSRHWRFEVAYAMVEKDPERALKLMSEWSTDIGFGTSGLKAVAKWAESDPRHAAEFMLATPQTSHVARGIMEEIGKTWGKLDPAAALDYAASSPNALSRSLGEAALKEWSRRDLNAAAE